MAGCIRKEEFCNVSCEVDSVCTTPCEVNDVVLCPMKYIVLYTPGSTVYFTLIHPAVRCIHIRQLLSCNIRVRKEIRNFDFFRVVLHGGPVRDESVSCLSVSPPLHKLTKGAGKVRVTMGIVEGDVQEEGSVSKRQGSSVPQGKRV